MNNNLKKINIDRVINNLCCLQTAFGNDNVFMIFQKYHRFLNPVSNITLMIYIKNVFIIIISCMFKHNINITIDMMYYLLTFKNWFHYNTIKCVQLVSSISLQLITSDGTSYNTTSNLHLICTCVCLCGYVWADV